jgi:hypothetical protein
VVNERKFGKEQIKVVIDRLLSNVPVSSFGDPVAGRTAYTICLYDQLGGGVASLRVNRPQDRCGTRPCWKTLRGVGFKYTDQLLAADGVLQAVLKTGPVGTGKVVAKGKRNLAKGLTALPIGVAGRLTSNRQATVQIVVSDAGCFTGTVNRVTEADGTVFKGVTP